MLFVNVNCVDDHSTYSVVLAACLPAKGIGTIWVILLLCF